MLDTASELPHWNKIDITLASRNAYKNYMFYKHLEKEFHVYIYFNSDEGCGTDRLCVHV